MKKVLMFIIIFLLSAILCTAEEKTILAAADSYPPFVDPSDVREGLSLVIIRAAYKTQGYTVNMVYVPWARAEAMVNAGKYDILPDVWLTNKRKETMIFSESYAVNTVKFIKRIDDPFEYMGIESLKGKRIGTIRGYGYGDEFNVSKVFTREEVSNLISNVRKLTAIPSRIDLTLEDEIVARVAIARANPMLLTKVMFTKNSLSSNKMYISSGLANPRHKEIIYAFNKGLAEIKKNGEYNKIFESYNIKIN